jgi:hypothetical protein
VAVCVWPAIAGAQPPDVVQSDSHGNTAAGTNALYHVAPTDNAGRDNTAIGNEAVVATTTGRNNSGTGSFALYYNTTGSDNTAHGYAALEFNRGDANTAAGSYALQSNNTGSYNTAVGYWALAQSLSGGQNTATGVYALSSNDTGSYNTATGRYALWKNTSGEINTAVGANALYNNTTGKQNTAVGGQALGGNIKGSNNVAAGFGALQNIRGNNNIGLGTNAGFVTKAGSNNIYIGSFGIGGAGESNVTRIGRVQTKTFIAGIKGVPLNGATVVVNAAGQLGVVASSARYKMDIQPLGDAADKLSRLRPVSYQYKTEPGVIHYGLIAEEVDKVMPELVVRDEEGQPESVQYLEIVPLLLKDRQELRAELAKQRALAERQQSRLDRQEKELAELRRMLATRIATRGGVAAPEIR